MKSNVERKSVWMFVVIFLLVAVTDVSCAETVNYCGEADIVVTDEGRKLVFHLSDDEADVLETDPKLFESTRSVWFNIARVGKEKLLAVELTFQGQAKAPRTITHVRLTGESCREYLEVAQAAFENKFTDGSMGSDASASEYLVQDEPGDGDSNEYFVRNKSADEALVNNVVD